MSEYLDRTVTDYNRGYQRAWRPHSANGREQFEILYRQIVDETSDAAFVEGTAFARGWLEGNSRFLVKNEPDAIVDPSLLRSLTTSIVMTRGLYIGILCGALAAGLIAGKILFGRRAKAIEDADQVTARRASRRVVGPPLLGRGPAARTPVVEASSYTPPVW